MREDLADARPRFDPVPAPVLVHELADERHGVWPAEDLHPVLVMAERPKDQHVLEPLDPRAFLDRSAPLGDDALDVRAPAAFQPLGHVLAVLRDERALDGVDELGSCGHGMLPSETAASGRLKDSLSESLRSALRPLGSPPDRRAASVCRALRAEDVPVLQAVAKREERPRLPPRYGQAHRSASTLGAHGVGVALRCRQHGMIVEAKGLVGGGDGGHGRLRTGTGENGSRGGAGRPGASLRNHSPPPEPVAGPRPGDERCFTAGLRVFTPACRPKGLPFVDRVRRRANPAPGQAASAIRATRSYRPGTLIVQRSAHPDEFATSGNRSSSDGYRTGGEQRAPALEPDYSRYAYGTAMQRNAVAQRGTPKCVWKQCSRCPAEVTELAHVTKIANRCVIRRALSARLQTSRAWSRVKTRLRCPCRWGVWAIDHGRLVDNNGMRSHGGVQWPLKNQHA